MTFRGSKFGRLSAHPAFKRDYRREVSGVLGKKLESLLRSVIELLADDKPLPQRHVDHALSGDWQKYRDCHIALISC
jgi:mRNA interferase YafQ